ncbi:MAG: HEAT repeat domain-containing protein [Planctomycetes bacterium]|nr:HEAT repeat domain-containing protein [Planctomycetota bacterium]MCC7172914.1 HEAT repeat domain-containing protein [Planctomycetota bacterium]
MSRRVPRSGDRRCAALCAALIVAGSLHACDDSSPPSAPAAVSLEQNRREDFLWADRLAIAPDVAKVERPPASAPWAARIAAATWDDLEGLAHEWPRGDAAARVALEDALRSAAAPMTRALAATLLGGLGDPAAAGPLCVAIDDPDAIVHVAAIRSLATLRVPWTMPRLIKTFGRYVMHPSLIARVEAAAALLRFRNVSGVPLCLRVLKEHTRFEDSVAREWPRSTRVAFEKESALAALATLTGDTYGYAADAPVAVQERAIERFDAWWTEHRDRLVRDQPRYDDAALLAKVDQLVQGLDVYQVSTSDDARFVLERLGPRMLDVYVTHLIDPSVYVRAHLLDVIAVIARDADAPSPASRAALERALGDASAAVRTQAVRVFGGFRRADLLPTVARGLQDRDASVRVAAAQALGDSGLREAWPWLEPLAARAQRDELWATAQLSLIRLGATERVDELLQMLAAEDVVDQSAALEALGSLGAPIGSFPLGGTPDERDAARQALRTWCDSRFAARTSQDAPTPGPDEAK